MINCNQKRLVVLDCFQAWIQASRAAQQITKANRNECHALCRNGKARATLRQLSSTVLLLKYLNLNIQL